MRTLASPRDVLIVEDHPAVQAAFEAIVHDAFNGAQVHCEVDLQKAEQLAGRLRELDWRFIYEPPLMVRG